MKVLNYGEIVERIRRFEGVHQAARVLALNHSKRDWYCTGKTSICINFGKTLGS